MISCIWKEVFIIKNNRKVFLLVFIVLISIFTACGKSNKSSNVDYNVVKGAFLTDKGYSNELSKHISQKVFKGMNIYSAYGLNNKKTYKVDFSLKEDSRRVEGDAVYVKMIYSVKIMDLQKIRIGGSIDTPITFIVKTIKGEWYISDKWEDVKK
ncbi:hypothetical protein [Clostridium estertheticum]|uniref:hypothetical protein n=1 Tax=Clostridium estertheticum TaxID=238834 RepID=UPI001CF29FFE|nr:hypothetical protein [Clostridium estertheticum]MCB2356452.1 hypothetical protein [Clostridium estertheticum]WAG43595.1 hypothetical protein LL065_24610 [Clostridium estertheticum]